jgi:nucleoside-diphosphate-sugar epimerase
VAAATCGHVVVAGATGIVGRAAVDHYAARGWRVTAVSRRPPMAGIEWPQSVQHLPLDLLDGAECEAKLTPAHVGDATHIVFTALYGVVVGDPSPTSTSCR